MFGKVIYFDKDKINEYKSVVLGEKNCVITEVSVANDKGVGLNFSVASGNVKASKNYNAQIQESLLLECSEFEKILGEKRDDYLDFTVTDGYDIERIPRGYIIKLDGILNIPENFDVSETLFKYKKFIIDENDEYAALLDNKEPKIPLTIEVDGELLCAKIDISNLKIEYVELEDYENIEVTILARMISNKKISSKKCIYDPLKDYVTLNRQLRRHFSNDRPKELSEIYADEDYYMIEIIAMYQ